MYTSFIQNYNKHVSTSSKHIIIRQDNKTKTQFKSLEKVIARKHLLQQNYMKIANSV
jgi:hypothetical protein